MDRREQIAQWRQIVNAVKPAFDHSHKAAEDEASAFVEADANLEAVEQAREILQPIAQAVQQKAHDRIAAVVSKCLAAVFPEPYEFEIEFVKKRGRTEANLWFKRNGRRVSPLGASGGGAVDVAAFALRLAALALSRPKGRPVVVLDEAFKFLSVDRRPAVREMLEAVADEMRVQIILVTHSPELVVGNVIQVS